MAYLDGRRTPEANSREGRPSVWRERGDYQYRRRPSFEGGAVTYGQRRDEAQHSTSPRDWNNSRHLMPCAAPAWRQTRLRGGRHRRRHNIDGAE